MSKEVNCERGKDEKKRDKRKSTSSAERAYVKALLKLKQQEDIIERGLSNAVATMKIDSTLLQNIFLVHREISTKRENFVNAICKELYVITAELESVKRVTENPRDLQTLDVNMHRLRLLKISQKIHDFKKSCCVKKLVEEQVVLEFDVKACESSLRKYDNLPKSAICKSPHRKDCKKEDFDYKTTTDFHALTTRTGHTGNWSEEDHLLFLKLRKKSSNVPSLVAALQSKCPDLSTESIVNHEAWYKVYVDLREKQKSAVKEWRKQKEFEKSKKLGNAVDSVEEYPEYKKTSNDTLETERIPSRKKDCRVEFVKSDPSHDLKENEKRELIKKWKIEKENKRTADEEQLKVKMELKEDIEKNQRLKRLKEIQETLCEYRKRKTLEAALREANGSSREKYKCDSTLIKAFRKQDEEYTRRRKNQISRLKESSKRRTVELKKSESSETQIRSTLLKTTKVWVEKSRAENGTRTHLEKLQYIKDVPRCYTRWRNEESADFKRNFEFS